MCVSRFFVFFFWFVCVCVRHSFYSVDIEYDRIKLSAAPLESFQSKLFWNIYIECCIVVDVIIVDFGGFFFFCLINCSVRCTIVYSNNWFNTVRIVSVVFVVVVVDVVNNRNNKIQSKSILSV